MEESGLTAFGFDSSPLSLDEHAVDFCSPEGTVHHLDVRFLATAAPGSGHTASDESLAVRRWPVDALPTTPAGKLDRRAAAALPGAWLDLPRASPA